jgi:hypothetical protein
MTGEYTFVTAERQNELTRRIQRRLAAAVSRNSRAADRGWQGCSKEAGYI